MTLAPTVDQGPGFDVILGNPPFLNQLDSITATPRGVATLVRMRSGGAIRGYTDLSASFLLFSTQITRQRGRVTMVQPQSLLAANDAAPVRRAILELASLESLWVSNEHVFEGVSVFTCAPSLNIGGPRKAPLRRSATGRFVSLPTLELDNDALVREDTWSHLNAAASGIPEITFTSSGTLADIAIATADFRDQYYGLDGFLVEDGSLSPEQRSDYAAFPPIVTTGLIDLARCHWGSVSCRLLKTKWQAPRIDRRRMETEGDLGPWIASRLVPKVLLATQTRVIEVFADADARFAPSVPVLTVAPSDPAMLWRIAAALASPVYTAIAMRKYAGAALSVDAIKLSAKQVLQLPLPVPSPAWDAAAEHFRSATAATDEPARLVALRALAEATVDAFQVPSNQRELLLTWWWARLTGVAIQEAANEHA